MPATRTTRTPLLLSLLLCAPLGGCSDQGDEKTPSTTPANGTEVSPSVDTGDPGTTIDTGDDSTDTAGPEPEDGDLDSDGDGLTDAFEASIGTDPDQVSSDLDTLTDYEEVAIHGTDPLDEDTDNDGLYDNVEVAPDCPCEVLIGDTDGDGLLDGDEEALGTDCDQEDSDGGGMPDGIEVTAGLNPDSDSDDVAYVGVNEVWQCTSMSEEVVFYDSSAGIDEFAFDNDEAYYSNALAQAGNTYIGTECVCNDVFVAVLQPTLISGVTVWTEQAVHLTDIGHPDRTWGGGWTPRTTASGTENGTDTAIASAVALTTGWKSQTLSVYDGSGTTAGGLEVGNDSDGDAAWMAFDASPVVPDGLGSTTAIDVTGAVDLRVSFGNPYWRPINECGELTYIPSSIRGDDHGLQVRVDALSAAAMAPPAFLSDADAQRCVHGKQEHTVFGFVPREQGGRAPMFLQGSGAYGHATIDTLQVVDWQGSDWLTLTHHDGRTHTLHKGQTSAPLPAGAPWHLAEVSWRMGRDAEGTFSEPIVGITHTCSEAGSPPPGPVPVDGYLVSYAQLDQVLTSLGLQGVLQTRWPGLTDLTHTPLRARVIVPDHWVDGPTQASLRIDVAGGATLWSLPLDPVLEPTLRSITPPRDVRSWTIHRRGARRTIEARLSQSAAGLTIHLDQLTLGGGSMVSLESPTTFTLPSEQ